MTGSFVLLLLTFLPQLPVLPNGNGANGQPAKAAMGTELDPRTNKYTLIIQISPESLPGFAESRDGSELPFPIDERIRPYIEQVVVRIGTGQLPQEPPPPNRINTTARNQPSIQTLDGNRGMSGNPVTVETMPANGNSNLAAPVLPYNNNGVATQGNDPLRNQANGNGLGPLYNNSGSSSNVVPNYADSRNTGSQGFVESPTLANTNRATQNDLVNPNNYSNPNNFLNSNNYANGLGPTQGTSYGMGQPQPGRPSTNPGLNTGSAAGSMFSRMTGGQQNGTDGYSMDPRMANGRMVTPPPYAPMSSNDFTRIAQNNSPLTYSNPPLNFNGTTSSNHPNVAGLPTNSGTTIPTGMSAGAIPGSVALSVQERERQKEEDARQSQQIRFWSIAALACFAFNIYQFFWMSSVRTRYREMVVSKRNAQFSH